MVAMVGLGGESANASGRTRGEVKTTTTTTTWQWPRKTRTAGPGRLRMPSMRRKKCDGEDGRCWMDGLMRCPCADGCCLAHLGTAMRKTAVVMTGVDFSSVQHRLRSGEQIRFPACC